MQRGGEGVQIAFKFAYVLNGRPLELIMAEVLCVFRGRGASLQRVTLGSISYFLSKV